MTNDEKAAIRKQLDVHEDEMNSYSRCECGHGLYNAAVALLAEIARLESASALLVAQLEFANWPVDCQFDTHQTTELLGGRICLTCHPELTDRV